MSQHELEQQLAAANARIERLERIVDGLQDGGVARAGAAVSTPVPSMSADAPIAATIDESEPAAVSRRRLLVGGATATVAGVSAMVATTQPAAAANGDALELGNVDQFATAPTGLSVNGTDDAYGFAVTDNGYSGSLDAQPTMLVTAKGENFSTALEAVGDGTVGALIRNSGAGAALIVDGGPSEGSVSPLGAVHATGNNIGVSAAGSTTALRALIDNTASGLVVGIGLAGFGTSVQPVNPGIRVNVRGSGATPTNPAVGVQVQSASGVGVDSTATAAHGVYGKSTSQYGVAGRSEASFGTVGVAKTGAAGVYGESEDGTGFGVLGRSAGATGIGVRGVSTAGTGTEGESQNGTGVNGISTEGYGVRGSSVTDAGVYGESNTYYGAAGRGLANHGVVGVTVSATKAGVYGLSEPGTSTGVLGEATTGTGVRGTATGAGVGIAGSSATGIGGHLVSDRAQLWLAPTTAGRSAPTGDATAHARGEMLVDGNGDLWYCTTSGTPGTWRKVSGPATAGALHVLAAPARVYDSRTGSPQGPKSQLAAGVARTLDLKAGGSGVPAGATAAVVTLLLVNAAAGDGNFTIWANGVAKPTANSMVWGGSAKRFSSLSLTSLDSQARCQVSSSVKTDFVLDVVGYYR